MWYKMIVYPLVRMRTEGPVEKQRLVSAWSSAESVSGHSITKREVGSNWLMVTMAAAKAGYRVRGRYVRRH